MPSNSYWSLLVLALAASTVSPVRCAKTQYVVFILGTKSPSLPDVSNSSGRQIEDRGDTSSAPSRHRTRGPGVYLGLGLAGALLAVALVTTFYHGGGGQQPSATRPTPQTTPSQPNNPPRAFVGRKERDLGFAVDTSSEPYPNIHLDDVTDRVFTSSEAKAISNQDTSG
jgi:hypothetical protein